MEHQFAQLQILARGHCTYKQLPADGEQILQLLGMTGAVELVSFALEDLREAGGALVIEKVNICWCHGALLLVQPESQVLVDAGHKPTVRDELQKTSYLNQLNNY